MALRNQPYLPLYVQDFLTDEKLIECSAAANGVYIRLMCIMHKSEQYGTILLKQNDKQNDKQFLNFACKLARQMPYKIDVISDAILELLENNVLQINGDFLEQKRMIKDNNLSEKRALIGKEGGEKTQRNNKKLALNFAKAKKQANTEIDIEIVNEYDFTFLKAYPNFETFFLKWIAYRKLILKPFKSQISVETCFKNLLQKSNKDAEIALQIIDQSIDCEWEHLHELKNQKIDKNKPDVLQQAAKTSQKVSEFISTGIGGMPKAI